MKTSLLKFIETLAVKSNTPSPAAQSLQELAELDKRTAALQELQSGKHIKQYCGQPDGAEQPKK